MKIWRFGIIGCGGIAKFHMKAIQEIEEAKLTAVASRSKEKAEEVGKREDCFWTDDYKELLRRDDVDIVSVTTSSGSHYAIGRDVLRAGKHLVLEKPMAMDVGEAAELISIAKGRGVTLSVISQRRFEPQHQLLKKLLTDKALGKLLLFEVSVPFYRTQDYYDSADWRGTIREDGGALMNQGIHSIDLLLWLAGRPAAVYGKIATQSHRMEAEDIGLSIIRFQNGVLGTLMASTGTKPGFPAALNVYGEKGTVKLLGSDIAFWSVEGIEPPAKQDGGSYGGTADPLSIDHIYHRLQLEDVIGAIRDGREPLVTGDDGMASIALIRKIYESSRAGSELKLE